MANGKKSNGNGKSYTHSYTIDGKSYDFESTGDKKPSPEQIMAVFKQHHAEKKKLIPTANIGLGGITKKTKPKQR